MATATSEIKLGMLFADGTTSTITGGPYATNAAALTSAKTNIINLNTNATAAFKSNFISKNGFSILDKVIDKASIETTQITPFNVL